jgi:hypothetical protein
MGVCPELAAANRRKWIPLKPELTTNVEALAPQRVAMRTVIELADHGS